jgi:WD40 repeat protein
MRDLFILHADVEPDATFARYLVRELGLEDHRVLLSSALPPGSSIVGALEQGAAARVTVAIVSPAFVHDAWARLGEELAAHHAMTDGLLVPLILVDCAIPLRLRYKVMLDCRDAGRRANEIRKLGALLSQPPPARRDVPCPYPGLRPFSAEDAALYHGRDAEVSDLVSRIAGGCRELYVVGPSGSGKSSLVLAGVVPRLTRPGDPVVGEPFVARVLRPGDAPSQRLAAAMIAASPAPGERSERTGPPSSPQRALIVIDQLEELFTLAGGDAQRALFAALDELRQRREVHLAFTLRADFFGALMQSALWPAVQRSHRHEIGPLRGDQLRAAIVSPARSVGVDLEPALVDRLLDDAAAEPGALPLIQEVLVHLWAGRRDSLMSAADYGRLGNGVASGLATALARRADTALGSLAPADQGIARRLFLRLVSFGDGRPDMRRQQPLAPLAAGEDRERFHAVLDHLAQARLVTTDGDTATGEIVVDLAHEVLIASWPQLAGWLRDQRGNEVRRRSLEGQAAAWISRGRGATGLLDDGELAELKKWLTAAVAREVAISDDATVYIAASEREVATRREALERLQRTAVLALAASDLREGLRLAGSDRPHESLAFLAAAYRTCPEDPVIRTALVGALTTAPRVVASLRHGDAVYAARFSPDGARVVTASADGTARLWDARGGAAIGLALRHDDEVHDASFSGDGTRVVTRSEATARLWDAHTGGVVGALMRHDGRVFDASFSRDGTRVVTASADRTVRLWDAYSGAPVGAELRHECEVIRAVFSPDGTLVATASKDCTAHVWDARTGEPTGPGLSHDADVDTVAFSPDGSCLLTAAYRGPARLWHPRTGASLGEPLDRADGSPVGFSPDGAIVLTASEDCPMEIWIRAPWIRVPWRKLALGAWRPREKYDIQLAAYSRDGSRVITGTRDCIAQLWNARHRTPIGRALCHGAQVTDVGFSPDGTQVVTASRDHTAKIWDARIGGPVGAVLKDGPVREIDFDDDGAQIVGTSSDGVERRWRTGTRTPIGPTSLEGLSWMSRGDLGLAVDPSGEEVLLSSGSPDGARVLTTSSQVARLWDVHTGAALGVLLHDDPIHGAFFSPDGSRVLTAAGETAQLWDACTGAALGVVRHGAQVYAVRFSPDGARVVTASEDGTARLLDVRTGAALGALLHDEQIRWMSFSPDGTRVVTVSGPTLRLWDVGTGAALGVLVHDKLVESVSFSSDGTRLVTASHDGTARLLDVQTGAALGVLVHDYPVGWGAFSPDGARVKTMSAPTATVRDWTARLWDAHAAVPLGPPLPLSPTDAFRRPGTLPHRRHRLEEVTCAAFSPDGSCVVAGSRDGVARLRDTRSGASVGERMLHANEVLSARFSPDGSRVVTASKDGTARLWDARTGGALGVVLFEPDDGGVAEAVFSPDGTRVVTQSGGGIARLWDVDVAVVAPDHHLLAEAAEAIGGYTVNEQRALVPIPDAGERWAGLRAALADAPAATASVRAFVRWLLDDPWARTVSPQVAVTVAAYIAERLADAHPGARAEVELAFAGHPLVRE